MNKKAFEIQFNWIFVLIAGAVILLFFTVILVKQKNISEISAKNNVLKSIELIITSASVTIDTTKIENIPNLNVQVECNRVSVGGISKQYQSLILFAPDTIMGGKLIWQTMPFNGPYRATNLLYMTGPQVRYILIGNSQLARQINKSLPSNLMKEFYEIIPISIEDKNNYKVKFVVFDNIDLNKINLGNLQNMQDSDVTAVRVDGDSSHGQIEFYEKNNFAWDSKGESNYLGISSLIGAVYSDTLEAYECNMKTIFSKLTLVNSIYKSKTEEMRAEISGKRQDCKNIYENALIQLTSISRSSAKLENSLDSNEITKISTASRELLDKNKEAQRLSCPLIY